MRKLILLSMCLSMVMSSFGQNCDVYIPVDEGSTLTYAHFNAKGKKESEHKQTLISKKEEPGATVFVVRQETTQKGELVVHDFTYRCEGDRFVFDMSSFLDPNQAETYKNTKMDISFDAIDIPYGVQPGTQLKNGSVTFTFTGENTIPISFKTIITDRKILAKESITTSAGSFDCLKITQTVVSQIGFIKVTVKSVEWLAKNVGVVKSETYSKADKLMGVMELVGLQK